MSQHSKSVSFSNLRDDFKPLTLRSIKTVTTFSLILLLLFSSQVDALVERFQHMRRTRPDGSCILVEAEVGVAFFWFAKIEMGKWDGMASNNTC